MRKAILAAILLTAALMVFGQHKPEPGRGKTSSSKTKTKPKPTPTPKPKSKWEQYTPCGVYYKDVDDFLSDIGKGWRLISETDDDYLWHDSDKELCDPATKTLKAWFKAVHKNPREVKSDYSLILYELKCEANQLRLKSKADYDRDGKLLGSEDYTTQWADAIPDSAGETILKTVCRQP